MGKKIYLLLAIVVAISSSIVTWIIFYGDLGHNAPVRAKKVFNIVDKSYMLSKDIVDFGKYNIADSVQTINVVISFNQGGNKHGCKSN